MAVNTKLVKTRINSVKNTKKITRAMQMIAAVKMRKSVESAVNTRMYSKLALDMIRDLGKIKDVSHPLLEKKSGDKTLLVIITSNRGLCGNYNAAVLKKAYREIADKSKTYSVIAVGKKAAQFAKKNQLDLVAIYDKISDKPQYEDIFPISKYAITEFENGNFAEVKVIFTNYISGLSQIVESLTLMPMSKDKLVNVDDDKLPNEDESEAISEINEDDESESYEFEPGQKEVLDYVIPMLIEVEIYQAILESAASEHSSRMIAMKNATEAAGEMIDSLTLEYNKARQAAITQEIAEITGGSEALVEK